MKSKLQSKLEEIAGILCKSQDKFDNPGVLSGISGLALFMFYWSRFTGDSKYTDIGRDALAKAVEMINNGYSLHTYCSGISGLAWTCEHLIRHRFIDGEDISFLNDLEPYLLSCMERDFDSKNYDFLHGGLGVGYYFLKKEMPSTMNNKVLYLWLKDTAITCADGCLKWESILRNSGKIGFNISLSHGMSSIVFFLVKLMKQYSHVTEIKDTLQNAVKYILQQQFTQPNISCFPSYSMESEEKPQPSRLAWCYGDLGIAQAILQAAIALGDAEYENTALKVLLHSCNRKDLKKNIVADAGLCHGTSGISHIYQRLHINVKNDAFRETSAYWMEKTLEMARFEDGPAGFKSWRGEGNRWENRYPLLEGIASIGLSVMSYLNPALMDWDECLLLS
ncbi:MAG: lanthionine synthetase C family protein [Dysgonamonadaceae bacterium]|nr:lanthionine synthetase C family protein [Dysgonamonadaceae bacterium]